MEEKKDQTIRTTDWEWKARAIKNEAVALNLLDWKLVGETLQWTDQVGRCWNSKQNKLIRIEPECRLSDHLRLKSDPARRNLPCVFRFLFKWKKQVRFWVLVFFYPEKRFCSSLVVLICSSKFDHLISVCSLYTVQWTLFTKNSRPITCQFETPLMVLSIGLRKLEADLNSK